MFQHRDVEAVSLFKPRPGNPWVTESRRADRTLRPLRLGRYTCPKRLSFSYAKSCRNRPHPNRGRVLRPADQAGFRSGILVAFTSGLRVSGRRLGEGENSGSRGLFIRETGRAPRLAEDP